MGPRPLNLRRLVLWSRNPGGGVFWKWGTGKDLREILLTKKGGGGRGGGGGWSTKEGKTQKKRKYTTTTE